jgi:hypothetical protein
MEAKIEFDYQAMVGKLDELQQVMIPRAGSLALNQAVYAASQELKKQAQNTFNNPVPFTVNAFLYRKSTPQTLEAAVFIRDEAPKGNPPSKYLLPQIYGGPHYMTRFQGSMLNTVVRNATGRNVQVGQRGKMLVPNLRSPKTRLNKYGNMTPGQYTQIQSALKGNISSADIYGVREKGEAPVNDQQLSKYIYLDEESLYEPYFRNRFTQSPKPGIYFVNRLKSGTKYYRVMTESRIPRYTGKFRFLDIAKASASQKFAEAFRELIFR